MVWSKPPITRGSVAELSGTVATPAPECAIGFGRARVSLSSADVVPCGSSDLSGARSVDVRAVAELTPAISKHVAAPTPECEIEFQRAIMGTSTAYVFPIG